MRKFTKGVEWLKKRALNKSKIFYSYFISQSDKKIADQNYTATVQFIVTNRHDIDSKLNYNEGLQLANILLVNSKIADQVLDIAM